MTPPAERRAGAAFPAALFLAAFALRAGYSLFHPVGTPAADAMGYDRIGWNIAQGLGFCLEPGVPTSIRGPGYPAFLALLYRLFGHSTAVVQWFQALTGAATSLLAYGIARRAFSETTARAAAWAVCVYPVLVAYDSMLLSESLFTMLLALCLWLLLRSGDAEGPLGYLPAGAVLGAATLTRPTTIMFPGVVLLVMLLRRERALAPKVLLLAAGFAAVVAPWTARNYRRFGVFLPVSTRGVVALYATSVMASEPGASFDDGMKRIGTGWEAFRLSPEGAGPDAAVLYDRKLGDEARRRIRSHPGGYARMVLKNFGDFWLTSHSALFGVDKPVQEYREAGSLGPIALRAGLMALQAALLTAAGLGFWRSRADWRRWVLLGVTLLYFNMHVLFDRIGRYHVPVLPYLLMAAAACLTSLCAEASAARERHRT